MEGIFIIVDVVEVVVVVVETVVAVVAVVVVVVVVGIEVVLQLCVDGRVKGGDYVEVDNLLIVS